MSEAQFNSVRPRLLIVDDVPANLKLLRDALEPEGYKILGAPNGETALRIAIGALPDIILLDVVMPDMNGYEVCRRLKENEATRHIPVLFVTVKEEKESLVEGFQVGGVDYITKPFEKEEVLARVETHLKISRLTQELLQKNQALQQEITRREQAEDSLQKADEHLSILSQQEADRWGIGGFIGKSKTIGRIVEDVRRLQSAGTTSVLITGESGTGKELVARAIHFGGTRANGPFIPVNCSAIPGELAESSFFGHVRGAFTGAHRERKGTFELADGGTLFLDEIGDMPLSLQPKLLRVIEDGCVMPVGGTLEKHVDVRILAASNQDLQEKMAKGAFREDLYFRLARFSVTVTPLRERKEDIPLLIEHFLKIFSEEIGIEQPTLTKEAFMALEAYPFPGNVRELKNIIEHALIQNGSPVIRPQHLHFMDVREYPAGRSAPPSGETERPLDQKQMEVLMVQRARKPTEPQAEPSSDTDEEKILAYVHTHDSISNPECRELLAADRHRVTYLLQKMERYGVLAHRGERRWARYYPA